MHACIQMAEIAIGEPDVAMPNALHTPTAKPADLSWLAQPAYMPPSDADAASSSASSSMAPIGGGGPFHPSPNPSLGPSTPPLPSLYFPLLTFIEISSSDEADAAVGQRPRPTGPIAPYSSGSVRADGSVAIVRARAIAADVRSALARMQARMDVLDERRWHEGASRAPNPFAVPIGEPAVISVGEISVGVISAGEISAGVDRAKEEEEGWGSLAYDAAAEEEQVQGEVGLGASKEEGEEGEGGEAEEVEEAEEAEALGGQREGGGETQVVEEGEAGGGRQVHHRQPRALGNA